MKSVVVCATRSGNTRRVAEAIADVLREKGEVEIYATEVAPVVFEDVDLLLIGGPTEGHGMTPTVKEYLERLPMGSVANRAVAAFDTRLAWPMILSGSAAAGISDRLQELGGRLIVPPESFIVDRTPELKPGELERASKWASEVSGMLTQDTQVLAEV